MHKEQITYVKLNKDGGLNISYQEMYDDGKKKRDEIVTRQCKEAVHPDLKGALQLLENHVRGFFKIEEDEGAVTINGLSIRRTENATKVVVMAKYTNDGKHAAINLPQTVLESASYDWSDKMEDHVDRVLSEVVQYRGGKLAQLSILDEQGEKQTEEGAEEAA